MAKLTSEQRNNLPDSDFALPGRRYPIPDKAHARDALARAAQMRKKGYLSEAEYQIIEKRANEVLGK